MNRYTLGVLGLLLNTSVQTLIAKPTSKIHYISPNDSFIIISEGEDNGYRKDQKVCINNLANKRITCATIYLARPTAAAVIMHTKYIARMSLKMPIIPLRWRERDRISELQPNGDDVNWLKQKLAYLSPKSLVKESSDPKELLPSKIEKQQFSSSNPVSEAAFEKPTQAPNPNRLIVSEKNNNSPSEISNLDDVEKEANRSRGKSSQRVAASVDEKIKTQNEKGEAKTLNKMDSGQTSEKTIARRNKPLRKKTKRFRSRSSKSWTYPDLSFLYSLGVADNFDPGLTEFFRQSEGNSQFWQNSGANTRRYLQHRFEMWWRQRYLGNLRMFLYRSSPPDIEDLALYDSRRVDIVRRTVQAREKLSFGVLKQHGIPFVSRITWMAGYGFGMSQSILKQKTEFYSISNQDAGLLVDFQQDHYWLTAVGNFGVYYAFEKVILGVGLNTTFNVFALSKTQRITTDDPNFSEVNEKAISQQQFLQENDKLTEIFSLDLSLTVGWKL